MNLLALIECNYIPDVREEDIAVNALHIAVDCV